MAKSEKTHLMLLHSSARFRRILSNPPTINDLRETGQLENDGHVVVLLHRGWSAEEVRVSKDGMMIIPKCRDGETGQFQTKFNGSILHFNSGSIRRYTLHSRGEAMNTDLMFSSATDLWSTPQATFDALHKEFNFERMYAPNQENAKCAGSSPKKTMA